MKIATVDIGNSRSKIVFWDVEPSHFQKIPGLKVEGCRMEEIASGIGGDGFLKEEVLRGFDAEAILESVVREVPSACIVSSVRKETPALIDRLREIPGLPVVNFNEEEMRRCYDLTSYKGHLGPDRLAAAIGANSLFPGKAKLVVDLGTAMTVDVVDKEGIFKGGNISLGIFGRLEALNRSTSKLPLVMDLNVVLPSFGGTTEKAIAAGAVNGVTGEILYGYREAETLYGVEKLVITGGDAGMVLEKLENKIDTACDPLLVARGLKHHLIEHYLTGGCAQN